MAALRKDISEAALHSCVDRHLLLYAAVRELFPDGYTKGYGRIGGPPRLCPA